MSKHVGTMIVRLPQSLLKAVRAAGLPCDAILREAGIEERELDVPDGRVPTHRFVALWRAILDRTDDPLIGLRLGLGFEVRNAGLVGYTMVHSRDLGSALLRLERYDRIIEDSVGIELVESDGQVSVMVDEIPGLVGLGAPIECDLGSLIACIREITGVRTLPARLDLPRAPPPDPGRYRALVGCDVRFHQRRAGIVVRREDLALAVVAADETLCSYLDHSADQVLSTLAATSFPQRVQQAVWRELSGGQPTLERIASVMATSPRTLQRRLAVEGLTYAELLDGFRHDMAVELLSRDDLAVYQVAFILGYSDASSFFKAFRRWEGVSPRRFRATRHARTGGAPDGKAD